MAAYDFPDHPTTNTSVAGPNGQVYVFDGVKWMPGPVASGGDSYWQGGSAGAIYYNAGSVGIGTASPTALLTVQGPTTGVNTAAQVKVLNSSGDGISLLAYTAGNKNISMGAYFNGSGWIAQDTGAVNFQQNVNGLSIYAASGLTVGASMSFVPVMSVLGNGYVGIGVLNPSSLLDVEGNVNGLIRCPFINQNTGSGSRFDLMIGCTPNGTTYVMYLGTDHNAYGHGESCYIDSNGPLAISASGNITSFWGNVGFKTGSPEFDVTLDNPGGVMGIRSGGYLLLRPQDNGWDMRLQASREPANANIPQLNILSGGNLNAPIASFSNGGNVGIGTPNPANILHCYRRQDGAITYLTIDNDGGSANTGQGISFNYGTGYGQLAAINHSPPDGANWQMGFKVWGGSAPAQVMTLDGSNKRVGVNTTSPYAALTVIPTGSQYGTPTAVIVAGESSNNPAYRCEIGYFSNGGTWTGYVQTISGGAGYPLMLNPLGGAVGINSQSASYALDVHGDCNISGTYRVNGAPFSTQWQFASASAVSRGFQVWYQNSYGRPLFLAVTVQLASQSATAGIYVGPATNSYFQAANCASNWTYIGGSSFTMIAFVPSGWYYYITYGGNVGLTNVIETY